MILGSDIDSTSRSSCQAREWEDKGTAAGILLTATGTVMAPDAICDGISPALGYASAQLRNCLDAIASGTGSEDLVYAGTKLTDCCAQIHNRVLEIGAFAGQGIYLGGVIAYLAGNSFLQIPFGGGCLYRFENDCLLPVGEESDTHLIRDAIGGGPAWAGKCSRHPRTDTTRLIYSALPFKDAAQCEQIIRKHSNEQNHINTVSMLLRRELMQSYPGSPTAVMELRL